MPVPLISTAGVEAPLVETLPSVALIGPDPPNTCKPRALAPEVEIEPVCSNVIGPLPESRTAVDNTPVVVTSSTVAMIGPALPTITTPPAPNPAVETRPVVVTVTPPAPKILIPLELSPTVLAPATVAAIGPAPPVIDKPELDAPIVESVPPVKSIDPTVRRVTAAAPVSLVETSPTVRSIGSAPALTTTPSWALTTLPTVRPLTPPLRISA